MIEKMYFLTLSFTLSDYALLVFTFTLLFIVGYIAYELLVFRDIYRGLKNQF